MPDDLVAYSLAEHPAPHREKIGLPALLYGLFAAPIVWAGDLLIDYGLAVHNCYAGREPHYDPEHGWIWPLILAFHLLSLVLIASGIAVAYRNWRITGPPQGHYHHLIEKGEGRTRYLGIIGMGFGAMFFLILAGMTIGTGMVPTCLY
jgi:hypothetical protein